MKKKSLNGRTFMLTDQCFYQEDNNEKDYNPDNRRKPHAISVVDIDTGTIRLIKSGSMIKVVKDAEK